MTYDNAAPGKLKKTQKWFASIITRPIDEDSRMNPVSPAGELMEEEAWNYIKPSPTLRPAQRIEIYNQQYWWRLLGILHDAFPLLTRLFGHHDFNQTIGFPFLQKYPPHSWSLSVLGEKLPEWVSKYYERSDKQLIYNSAKLDWAFSQGFLVEDLPPLKMGDMSTGADQLQAIEMKLSLHPSLHLFAFEYDLVRFREEFLKHPPEYWIENDFPNLSKQPTRIVLYRNVHKDVVWEEVMESEYNLLSRFQKGTSIVEACNWLEKQKGADYKVAAENIQLWLQKWVVKQWLTNRIGKA